MSSHIFDEILASFGYTRGEVQYYDGLLYVRKIEEAWNKNIADAVYRVALT